MTDNAVVIVSGEYGKLPTVLGVEWMVVMEVPDLVSYSETSLWMVFG